MELTRNVHSAHCLVSRTDDKGFVQSINGNDTEKILQIPELELEPFEKLKHVTTDPKKYNYLDPKLLQTLSDE